MRIDQVPRTTAFVCLAVVAAIPLAVDPTVLFAPVVPKGILLRIAGIGMAFALVAAIFTHSTIRASRDSLTLAMLAFLAVAALSSVVGVSWTHSLHGDIERMGGLISWASLGLVYIGARTFLDDEGWTSLVSGIVAVGVISATAALIVYAFSGRLTATFGNQSYLAIHAVLLTGISLVWSQDAGKDRRRLIGVLGLALAAALIILASGQAAAPAAAGAGLLAAGMTLICIRMGRHLVRSVEAILIALPWMLALLSWSIPAMLRGAGPLRWAGSDSVTIGHRLIVWDMARSAASERPLTGVGAENFMVASSQHFDPAILAFGGRSYIDRAHNVFLEYFSTTGIFGLIAYCLAWSVFFSLIFRGWRRERWTDVQFLALIATSVSYLMYLTVWFEDLSSATLWSLVVAWVASRATDTRLLTFEQPRNPAGARWILFALCSLIILGSLQPLVLRVQMASQAGRSGTLASEAPPDRVASFVSALDGGNPEAREIVISLVDYLQDFPSDGGPYAEAVGSGLQAAVTSLDQTIADDPYLDLWWLQRASVLTYIAGFTGNVQYLDLGIADMEQAVRLSPGRIANRTFLAQQRLLAGDTTGALRELEVSQSIDPDYPNTYWYLAEIAADRGDLAGAVEALDRIWSLGDIPPARTVEMVATALRREGDSSRAMEELTRFLESYEERVEVGARITPEVVSAANLLADLHREAGREWEAEELGRRWRVR